MADNVRYVSREFIDYIKDTYGITSTDKTPALITIKNFQCHAFKDLNGDDIAETFDIPKDLIVFTEKNGFIPQKGKTKKYALNLKLASPEIYNNEKEKFEPKRITELKFSSTPEMGQYVAFSHEQSETGRNIFALNEINEIFKLPKNTDYLKLLKYDKKIETEDGKVLNVVASIYSLQEMIKVREKMYILQNKKNIDEIYFITDGAGTPQLDKYTFIYFKSNYRGKIEKGDVAVTLRESYNTLRDIVGKSSESYLFMYLSGNKKHEEFAEKLKKMGSYDIEESYIPFKWSFTSNVVLMIRGCFRKTYYNKVIGNNAGDETLIDFNNEKQQTFIDKLKVKIFGQKSESKFLDKNDRYLLKEENLSWEQKVLNAVKEEISELYAIDIVKTIDGLEKSMSEEYLKAKENKYYLGRVANDKDGKKYEELTKQLWFLFHNEEQAKELHNKFKERLGVEFNKLLHHHIELVKQKVFEKVFSEIQTESNISDVSIKNNLYKLLKEESEKKLSKEEQYEQWWKDGNFEEEIKKNFNEINEQYINAYEPNNLTLNDFAINVEEVKSLSAEESAVAGKLMNQSFNIISIKSNLYRIISEAEGGKNKKEEKGTAIFIPDVMLQNNRDGNYFAASVNGRDNEYVENCYLKTGLATQSGDIVKFILDVWSPLSATIEGLGAWLDKGLVDMGDSWVAMLGKGMKTIGSVASSANKGRQIAANAIKGKQTKYQSLSDKLKS